MSQSVVAILNTSPDTAHMLRPVLQEAGFTVVSAYTRELRDGDVDPVGFVRTHAPGVVIYDIAPPYDANWGLFLHVHSVLSVEQRRCVLTTTNVLHLQQIAGETQELYEIVGKPSDLGQVVDAAKSASGAV